MLRSVIRFLAALLLCLATTSDAFAARHIKGASTTSSTALHMTVLNYKGNKQNFAAGSSLKAAVSRLGVKPKYSCRKGDCGSCTLSVGGQRVKPCVGKVPPEPRLKSLIEKGLEVR